MSDEDRKGRSEERSAEREHRSVLAGMSRKEAEALARSITGVTCTYSGPHPAGGRDALDAVRALAALGAEVVGAREMWMARHTGLVYSNAEAAGKARLSVLVLPEGE